MTIVVHPARNHETHPAGRLATTLLAVAVAGAIESSRYRRGRLLVLEGAVIGIELTDGLLTARVQGSLAVPYDVTVTVPPAPRPPLGDSTSLRTHLGALTPAAHELRATCSCPDPERPCKHIAAALLCFAEHLTSRPDLLVEWRCQRSDAATIAAGSRAARRPLGELRSSPPATRRFDHGAGWNAFVGGSPPTVPEVPDEPATVGTPMFGTLDLGAWVRSALDHLGDRT